MYKNFSSRILTDKTVTEIVFDAIYINFVDRYWINNNLFSKVIPNDINYCLEFRLSAGHIKRVIIYP